MGLVLRVRKLRGTGAQRPDERRFNDARFSIGRSDENDLILEDSEISRSHAYLERHGDTYEIVDVSRNGVLLNGARIPFKKPQTLRDGDRIQIENYEITALIDEARPKAKAGRGTGSVDPSVDPERPRGAGNLRSNELLDAPRNVTAADGPPDFFRTDTNESVLFKAKSAPAVSAGEDFDARYNNASSMQDHIELPKVSRDPRLDPKADDDSDIFKDFAPNPTGSSDVSREQHGRSSREDADPEISQTPVVESLPPEPAPARVEIHHSNVGVRPQIPEASDVSQQTTSITALLEGLGVDPATPVDDEVLREIGQSFSILLEAIIDLVATRAEVKRQLGLGGTQLQASGNNPIKITQTVQDALDQLFFEPRKGFLSGAWAAQDTVADLKAHEMAILSGIQVLNRELPSRIDPQRLERQFDEKIKRLGLLAGLVKSRYWELYKEFYADEVVDKNFVVTLLADAYEETVHRLERPRGK